MVLLLHKNMKLVKNFCLILLQQLMFPVFLDPAKRVQRKSHASYLLIEIFLFFIFAQMFSDKTIMRLFDHPLTFPFLWL